MIRVVRLKLLYKEITCSISIWTTILTMRSKICNKVPEIFVMIYLRKFDLETLSQCQCRACPAMILRTFTLLTRTAIHGLHCL